MRAVAVLIEVLEVEEVPRYGLVGTLGISNNGGFSHPMLRVGGYGMGVHGGLHLFQGPGDDGGQHPLCDSSRRPIYY